MSRRRGDDQLPPISLEDLHRERGVSRVEGEALAAFGTRLTAPMPLPPTRAMVDWFEQLGDDIRRWVALFWTKGLRIPGDPDPVANVRGFMTAVPFDLDDVTLALILRAFADYAVFCVSSEDDSTVDVALMCESKIAPEDWDRQVSHAVTSWRALQASGLSNPRMYDSFRQGAALALEPDPTLLSALKEFHGLFS